MFLPLAPARRIFLLCFAYFFVLTGLGVWANLDTQYPLDLAIHIPFGWIEFLKRVLPLIQPNYMACATAVFCLTALLFGGDRFARWLCVQFAPGTEEHNPPAWRFRWTAMSIALVALLFVSGTCVVGIAHQTIWLIFSTTPVIEVESTVRFPEKESKKAKPERGERP